MGATGKLVAVTVAGFLLTSATSLFPQNWTLTSAPLTNWTCVASSADGNRLVAAASGGLIYASTNAGTTWTTTDAPSTNWSDIASSADGSKLVALTESANWYDYRIFTSTNSGTSWILSSVSGHITSVASSATGSKMAAVTSVGPVFLSTNSGVIWTETLWRSNSTSAIACSADGDKLVVVPGAYTSTNFGFAWTWPSSFTPAALADLVASSADGNKLVASWGPDETYTSTNAGITWSHSNDPRNSWHRLACSADGDKLVGVAWQSIDASTNSGSSWVEFLFSSTVNFWSVASSADGCKLVAVVNGGGIYSWQTTPTPVLNLTPSGGSFVISWIVPSMPFVLQENADLNTTNWIDVPTQPNLNLTNLHHEVSVPLSNTNRFYRLKSL
jgi:hypothetical protein